MSFLSLIDELREALERPLPGREGQKRLAPRPRSGWRPGEVPDDVRLGAGLLLVYPIRQRPHVVLTLRGGDLPVHPGQVSLPGGAVEPDESVPEAALREGQEEVGIEPRHVEILGELSPLHIPRSGFVLHPVVATTSKRPDFRAEPGEVERILEVPLDDLGAEANYRVELRSFRDREFEVPFLEFDGERVWGATLMVLSEFLTLLDRAPDPWETG